MAEFISEFRERLLPEYEQMKNLNIFTDDQIREIIRRRDMLMHKIYKSPKLMVDYADFILYEKLLHKNISEKEKRHGQNYSELKHSIVNRIMNLYREILRYFPHEIRLWEKFIIFAKKSVPNSVNNIYEKMLSFHGDKTAIWCDAAIWSYGYRNNMNKVKEIFFRGLQRHSDSELLNITFFEILIKEATKMSTTKISALTPSEQELGLERAVLVYRNSKSNISNVTYYIKLLKRCEDELYSNLTVQLQKEIINDLMTNFPRDELVWNCLALRELNGFSMIDLQLQSKICNQQKRIIEVEIDEVCETKSEREDKYTLNVENIWQKRTFKQRLLLCMHIYQIALRTLKTSEICSYFINSMLKLNQDLTNQPVLKRRCLSIAFKEGHNLKLMKEDYYYSCVKMLLKSPQGIQYATNILNEASHLSKSLLYYKMRMIIYITANNEKDLLEVFHEAKDLLSPKECVSLWHLMIKYYSVQSDDTEKNLKFLKNAAMQFGKEYAPFRALYLDYISTIKTLDKTREEYDELSQMPPPCLELHRKMAMIEKHVIQQLSDKSRWRKCYENAALYFGKTNKDVWIDYIKFERDNGEPKNMGLIFERGKQTLQADLVDNFIADFTLLKANIV